jgi:hypothetical protein
MDILKSLCLFQSLIKSYSEAKPSMYARHNYNHLGTTLTLYVVICSVHIHHNKNAKMLYICMYIGLGVF